MSKTFTIDGWKLEGGGQIFRICVGLATILNLKIKFINIRGKRTKKYGLRPQTLAGLRLVQEICNAEITGDTIGSQSVTFTPNKITSGEFFCDPLTAGSISLLTQISIPVILFGPSNFQLILKGGTHVNYSPPIHDVKNVLLPILSRFGAKLDLEIEKYGFNPKGGGQVLLTSKPIERLYAIQMVQQGVITKFTGISYSSGKVKAEVSEKLAILFTRRLKQEFGIKIPISIKVVHLKKDQAIGNGCGICVHAHTSTDCILSTFGIGKKHVSSKDVVNEAADRLFEDIKSGTCLDRHHQDQVILFMALAQGVSKIKVNKITSHTETAIHFVRKLTGVNFPIEEIQGSFIISCEGLGFCNKFNLNTNINKKQNN
ncbi:RNA 3'-terminal phosphate cyclase [Anaeramoeba flamelloides]|uniref:RNA 3'-terminal-phosphate cyclase (ATP) n=1 Tax=Anaeramoeba flamelloides TaxID=1746091 RepID=A0AAV8AFW1_9EUKA|nr:RNA 3'-terminal phosphate cyclase [Anaeramoeba flamelloides]